MKSETSITRVRKKIKENIEWYEKKRTIKALEKILGFCLHDWQIQFIFEGKLYSKEIRETRANDKTTAHILRLCLSHGLPIIAKRPPREESEISMWMGEDRVTLMRRDYFICELKRIYEMIQQDKNLKLREIIFMR